jgi:hypothetical protein
LRPELRLVSVPIHEVLALPLDKGALLAEVRELRLARGQRQDPFYHLGTFEHILETVWAVERELAKGRIVARMGKGGHWGLRLVALLHDIAGCKV